MNWSEQIDALTMADVAAAKLKRGALTTIEFHLSQVTSEHGDGRSLDKAKEALKQIKR